MKKKVLVLLVVTLLLALTIQVAFAHHDFPKPPDPLGPPGGSCHMNWWEPGEGPGEHKGVKDEDRGMYHVHMREGHPQGYTKGATHMDDITAAHGCPVPVE